VNSIRWSNDNELRILSAATQSEFPRRQFLVFVVPGANASPLLSLGEHKRNFDLAVRFYMQPGLNQGLLDQAEFVMTGGLSKFHAAALFIESCGLRQLYDGYMFLDGDLQFDASQLSQFLSFVHAAKLDLAQPCVTRDSYCYWKMAYHQPGYVFRETSFVEVMAPYLSRSALSNTIETFTRSISTYGLDLVWPSLIGGTAIGVVDAFQVRHLDRVDHISGNFYKYLKSIGVDLDAEEHKILTEYGVTPERAHSRRGYFWKSAQPCSGRPPRLVSVLLGQPESRTQRQLIIDAAMRFARSRFGSAERSEDQLAAAIGPYLSGSQISSLPKG
jgi:hypothetical protein